MQSKLFCFRFSHDKLFLILILSTLLLISPNVVKAQMANKPQKLTQTTSNRHHKTSLEYKSNSEIKPSQDSEDPLNSSYPLPWNWILNTYSEFQEGKLSNINYYRTPFLISPDGKFATYTRITMLAQPQLFRCKITSKMFLENLETGELQTIHATSPLAEAIDEDKEIPGAIAILIPASWSENGNLLLARQFEGFFNTSDASDYAAIWDRQRNQTFTIAPNIPNIMEYTNAILLGWNDINPDEVLFRVGNLGEDIWPVFSVGVDGKTTLANSDEIIFSGHKFEENWGDAEAFNNN